VPALPSWLTEPLWDQFAALLPERPEYHPDHPLGCHRRRISDRIIFDKMLQLLRFGCSYEAIADTTCSATTIRSRRDEWIRLGVFARLKQIALDSYDRIVGLVLDQIAVDGSITKAPGGGEVAGRSPVDRGKQGLKRSGMTDGYGIPLAAVHDLSAPPP
jgi:transposase